MNPMLTEALVAPRIDDLRRSARSAGVVSRRSRGTAPATPLPAWALAVRRSRPVPALSAEPCTEC
ncbi:MAG TPA: hypothetical protein VFC09_14330 [Candidatus Dormibacteraeota bacterium]|nr:hypothetical protein [Candidatus Dormibacteraeota bacterium]